METEPVVWRRVLVHSDTTLHGLHRTIQFVIEWLDYHLCQFTVRGERYQAPLPEADGEDARRVTLGLLCEPNRSLLGLTDPPSEHSTPHHMRCGRA